MNNDKRVEHDGEHALNYTQQFRVSTRAVRESQRRPASHTRFEFAIVVILSVVIGHFVAAFDAMEGLLQIAERYKAYEVDEMLTILIVLALLLGVFAWRRSIDLRRQIVARDKAETDMRHLAMHDALTGLPNRTQFSQRLNQELSRALRDGRQLAVLSLDLDGFKQVNDFYGHAAGDELLVAVGDRLLENLRDIDTVARLGGDEFAIVLPETDGPEKAAALADRIVNALSQPFLVSGHDVSISTSIGITLSMPAMADPEELMRSADIAMYRAKAEGRCGYKFFEPGMDAKLRERRELETGLRTAVENGEFEVHYQPLYSIPDKTLRGFEALLRWQSPKLGAIPPCTFIPIAEEMGLISRIGDWVLEQACGAARDWPKNLVIAVNVSPVQFKDGDLASRIDAIVTASGLEHHRLEIEITEGVLIKNTEETLKQLRQLKQAGTRVSMDDFGTGYSSLSYLRKFPFDKIKIDRSLLDDLDGNAESDAIVRAIVAMGRSLGMTTLAEGVESTGQFERLTEEGCEEAQGFLLGKPMPVGAVRALLDNPLVGAAANDDVPPIYGHYGAARG